MQAGTRRTGDRQERIGGWRSLYPGLDEDSFWIFALRHAAASSRPAGYRPPSSVSSAALADIDVADVGVNKDSPLPVQTTNKGVQALLVEIDAGLERHDVLTACVL